MAEAADEATREPMRPRQGRRFRRATRYVHQRSEGMTRRRNGGSSLQPTGGGE